MSVVLADPGVLSWRPLAEGDFGAVAELAARCLETDGGQPFAASLDFLRRSYPVGRYSRAGFDSGRLVCVTSLQGGWLAGPGSGDPQVTTALLDPSGRRPGVGASAFDWMRVMAGGRAVRTEAGHSATVLMRSTSAAACGRSSQRPSCSCRRWIRSWRRSGRRA